MKNRTYYIVIILGMLILNGCSEPTTQERFNQANDSFKLKHYQLARVQAKSILKDDPNNIEARVLLAKTYQIDGLFTNAEKEWHIVLDGKIDVNIIATSYFQALYALNDPLSIIDFWDEHKNKLTDTNKADATIVVSLALLSMESPEKSRTLINEGITWAKKSNNKQAETVAQALKVLFSATANKQQQMNSLANACREFPNRWIICTISANVQVANNEIHDATVTLENLLTLLPYHYRSKIILAENYIKLNNKEKALQHLTELLKMFPKQAYINQLMAMYNLQNTNFEKAKLHIDVALSQGLKTSETKLIAGLTNYQLENYEQASGYIISLNNDFPNNSFITKILTAIQLKLGDNNAIFKRFSGVELTEENTQMIAMASLELLKAGAKEQSTTLLNKVDVGSITDKELLTQISLAKIANGDSSSVDQIEGIVNSIISDNTLSKTEISNTKYLLISSLLTSNQLDRAKEQVEIWIANSPKEIENYLLQAEIQKRTEIENIQELQRIYQKIIELDISNSTANLYLASLAYKNRNYQKANLYFENIILENKYNIKALQGYYLASKAQNQELEALDRIENILLNKSSEPKHRLMLAQILIVAKKFTRVIQVLENDKFSDSRNIEIANLILADSYLSIQKYKEAIQRYNLLLLKDNIDFNVLNKKLYAHKQLNDLSNAIADLNRLNLDHPGNPLIILSLADFQVIANMPADAMNNINKLSNEQQKLPIVNRIKGSALHRSYKYEEAIPYLLTSYKLNKDPKVAAMIFDSLILTQKRDEAITQMKAHLENFPLDSRNRSLFASELSKTDRKSAINEYIKVIDEDKNNIIALNNLAWYLFKENQLKRAEFYINKAKVLAPKSVNIDDTYQKIKLAIKNSN